MPDWVQAEEVVLDFLNFDGNGQPNLSGILLAVPRFSLEIKDQFAAHRLMLKSDAQFVIHSLVTRQDIDLCFAP